MAGIGFVLRRLTRQDDLLGILQGFAHSALAANGPWLFTILTLAGLSLVAAGQQDDPVIKEFRVIVIYNFSFSLVLSGPVLMVATRTLADLIYEKKVEQAPGILIGGLAVMVATQLPLAAAFYFGYVRLPAVVQAAAVGNFLLVSALWLASVFLSALKDYRSISVAFALGMPVAIAVGWWLSGLAGIAGLLLGFSLGLALTFFLLAARILAEYPYRIGDVFAFLTRVRTYRLLALSGLVYNVAIWVDKWIMWSAPEAERLASGLVSYPHYDSAMFLAYLTITPAMALFMVVIETRFFESYLQYYRDVERHAAFDRIRANHRDLVAVLMDGVRNMVVVQGSISLFVILAAPTLFALLFIDFQQIGMFRLGVFGSLYHVLVLVLLIVLAYFDFRTPALLVQLTFLVSNALFTWFTLALGFSYYGLGYLLATLLTFAAAYLVTYRYVSDLPYQSFVHYNQAVLAARG